MAKFEWTKDLVETLVAEYTERRNNGEHNRTIIADLVKKADGLTAPRVRGKLMAEKVYVKDTEAEKNEAVTTSTTGVGKDELINKVLERLGLKGDKVLADYFRKRMGKDWLAYIVRECEKADG